MRILAILTGWIGLVAAGFWFLVAKFFIPVERPSGSIDPKSILGKSAPTNVDPNSKKIVVLNFWNPDCPCSRFMDDHIKDIQRQFPAEKVKFIHVIEGVEELPVSAKKEITLPDRPSEIQIDADGSLARKYGVWAAPGAVVLDRQGKVAYVGAYNTSRYCDDKDGAYAQKAIEALLKGQSPKVENLPFYGCRNLGTP